MTNTDSNPYAAIGETEPVTDDDSITVQPRAGDVCKLRDDDDFWIPYGGLDNREEHGTFRFARYPAIDRVQWFDAERICAIVVPIEDELAQEAWARIEKVLPGFGTFIDKVFVFRAHDGECATTVWVVNGMQRFGDLHADTLAARRWADLVLAQVHDVEVVWCIGREQLEPHITSGALPHVTFGDQAVPS